MKRFIWVFWILLFGVMVMGQILPSWGYKVTLGTSFFNTDSLALRDDAKTDTIPASGTLYSDVLLFPGDRSEGIYSVSISLDTLTASTTASVYIRLYYGKHLQGYFGPWKKISTTIGEQYYPYVFQLADSTWWGPAAGRQFKVVNNTGNAGIIRIIEFPR